MNAILSSRYMGLLATSLLLGFVATVYLLRGGSDAAPQQMGSARLQSAPHFRVVTDPVELAQLSTRDGAIPGIVADVAPSHGLSGGVPADADRSDAAMQTPNGYGEQGSGNASASTSSNSTGNETGAPSSLGIAGGAANAETDPAIQELRDLGMAMVMTPGANWYTLQTAYVPADDINLLKRRILEASSALGSREGMFIYTAERNGRTFYGLCARRFETGGAAKTVKGKLDHKLGYPSQLRSKNGLQKEMGL